MAMGRFAETQIRRVFHAPNYIRAFGIRAGIRLLLAIERSWPRKSNTVHAVKGPGFPARVHLRKCVSDHAIFWQCLVMQQYDLSPFAQTARLLEQYREILGAGHAPLIIDAGGNIGLAAFWFAWIFPEASIVSVEPDPANFALLRRNVAVFGDRVRPVHGAVTEIPKAMRIVNPDAGAASFQVEPADASAKTTVRGFTISELSASIDDSELFIVKIDIEGGQKFLFADNTNWIDEAHLIVIEIEDWVFPWQATCENFFREISKRRFDYLLRGENLFCYRHVEPTKDARASAYSEMVSKSIQP
jgi:FkbM family methyltransferase